VVTLRRWPYCPNKNVLSERLNCPYDSSGCRNSGGKLFHSRDATAANVLSPKVLWVRICTLCVVLWRFTNLIVTFNLQTVRLQLQSFELKQFNIIVMQKVSKVFQSHGLATAKLISKSESEMLEHTSCSGKLTSWTNTIEYNTRHKICNAQLAESKALAVTGGKWEIRR